MDIAVGDLTGDAIMKACRPCSPSPPSCRSRSSRTPLSWTTRPSSASPTGRRAAAPRRTADAPWLGSFVLWANALQYVGDDGITVAELRQQARTSRLLLGGLRRWRYVDVEPPAGEDLRKPPQDGAVVRVTPGGRRSQQVWSELPHVMDVRWRDRRQRRRTGGEPRQTAPAHRQRAAGPARVRTRLASHRGLLAHHLRHGHSGRTARRPGRARRRRDAGDIAAGLRVGAAARQLAGARASPRHAAAPPDGAASRRLHRWSPERPAGPSGLDLSLGECGRLARCTRFAATMPCAASPTRPSTCWSSGAGSRAPAWLWTRPAGD